MAKDLSINNINEFMRLLYAIIKQHEADSEYYFEFYPRKLQVGKAYLPDFLLALKHELKEVPI